MTVLADGSNRSVLAEERVSPDEPGPGDGLALGVGNGEPDPVRQLQPLLEGRSWRWAVWLRPLVRQLRVLRAGKRGNEQRTEVRVQAPHQFMNVQACGLTVPCDDGR